MSSAPSLSQPCAALATHVKEMADATDAYMRGLQPIGASRLFSEALPQREFRELYCRYSVNMSHIMEQAEQSALALSRLLIEADRQMQEPCLLRAEIAFRQYTDLCGELQAFFRKNEKYFSSKSPSVDTRPPWQNAHALLYRLEQYRKNLEEYAKENFS